MKILVTGSSGLVGSYLIKELMGVDDNRLHVVAIDMKEPQYKIKSGRFKFLKANLIDEGRIKNIINSEQPDVVVNLFGIKGSPIRAKESPVDFLYPSFKINTEIIDLCAKKNIYLVFVSSVGVYAPAEKFVESDVWKTLPSEHDWFPSWSKRMGEMLLEAYKVQYNYTNWSIIRPANIYGEYDDFSGNGTVISSTVKKVIEATDSIECWGDGSPTRDFVFGGDVAKAIIQLYENKINDVVNFGSGEEITIKSMVENLVKISCKDLTINWDPSKPNGDLRRQMDVTKQTQYNLLPKTSFYDGLKLTYKKYQNTLPTEGLEFLINDYLYDGYHIGKMTELISDMSEFSRLSNEFMVGADRNAEYFGYRYEYNDGGLNLPYKKTIKNFEIAERTKLVQEKGYKEIQKWGEFFLGSEYFPIMSFMRKNVEEYVSKIYPDLIDNFQHQDSITLYENGDFIEPHTDGMNHARYCVVLAYLSNPEDYNDGGGKLVLGCGDDVENYVEPTNLNFVLIDFTKSETMHAVEAVKNNFKRFTYIDFIYNAKMTRENHQND
jgi:GDP-L-fucose synthase